MNTETKVGLFVLGGLGILLFAIVQLSGWKPGTYTLHVYFNNVQGLPEQAQVFLRGIRVGNVARIALDETGNRAQVTVRIRRGVKVHEDARARILTSGFVGTKYLEIIPGSPKRPVLKDGQFLIGIEPIPLDEKIDQAIRALDRIVKTFEEIGGPQGLRAAVRNIVATTKNIQRISADVREITSRNKDKVASVLDRMDRLLASLEEIAGRLERGEGAAGLLLTDARLRQDLSEAVRNVRDASHGARKLFGGITLPDLSFDYGLRFDVRDERFHHDLRARLGLGRHRYFLVGAENIGPVQAGDRERANTVRVVAGQDIGPLSVYGGAIRSEGGAGLAILPFGSRGPVRLVGEVYDLDRTEPKKAPIVRAGGEVQPLSWLRIGAFGQDLFWRPALQVEGGITLRP